MLSLEAVAAVVVTELVPLLLMLFVVVAVCFNFGWRPWIVGGTFGSALAAPLPLFNASPLRAKSIMDARCSVWWRAAANAADEPAAAFLI